MRINLNNLTELEKLKYAIECMEHNVSFPLVILEFLTQHGLYDLVTKPKVQNEISNLKSNTTSKS